MSEESEEPDVIVGAPNPGLPLLILKAIYGVGAEVWPGKTLCEHSVILGEASRKFLAENPGMEVICSECVEAYAILHGGAKENHIVPGTVEEMEQHFGKERTHLMIWESQDEVERRFGGPVSFDPLPEKEQE